MLTVRCRPAGLLPLLLTLLLGGCASWQDYFVTYSDQSASLRNQLRLGQAAEARKAVRESTPGDGSYVLDRLEEGRIALLAGDVAGSRRALQAADMAVRADDERARIRVRDGLEQAGSLLSNDQTMTYAIADFERTLLHHYLAIDYLLAGEREGALVELRLANQAQEAALARRRAAVADERERQVGQQLAQRAPALDRLQGGVKHGFLNPYTFYFSALLYEADGALNDAWVDLNRAIELAPDNRAVQDALLRLARLRGAPEEIAALERRVGRKAPAIDPKAGNVVVLYEEGIIAARRELWLPLPLSTSAGDFRTFTVALPYYDNRAEPSVPLAITAGKAHGSAEPLANLEALAAYDLQEKLPGMATRQLLRLVTKEQLRRVAADKGNDVGNLVVGLFNTLSEHADTRSWSTLPARAAAWSAEVPAGRIELLLNGRGESVEVRPGRTTLVWVTRVSPHLQIRSVPL
ncbi:COG3014 family protein [Aeromonas simiae]|uniref:COG3014 family protein n=1 Tax=Aeromonas simiae TaxID=218936 RepID=UPI0005A9ADA4|nr:hypothetical protein [Aeromonas simiae]MDO2953621.1 hypothetical protein [Aeromonas simiae]